MDLDDLRSRVQAKVTVDDTDLLDGWINDGVLDFMLQTGIKVAADTVSLSAGVGDYTLDTDILAIREMVVTSAGDDYNLVQVTPHEIRRWRRGLSGTGSPVYRYAVEGANLLMVYPTPSSADVLTVYYVPRPATLASGSDVPSEIPAEFHKAVELYALGEAADADDDSSSAQGQRYRDGYALEVAKARRSKLTRGGSRLPVASLARRRWVRHREDVYP